MARGKVRAGILPQGFDFPHLGQYNSIDNIFMQHQEVDNLFQPIQLDCWPRRAIFQEFMGHGCTFALTRQLTITHFHRFCREHRLRFYPALTWAVTTAVNCHREFRMGYDAQGRPGYYDLVHPEYTVLDPRTQNMDSLCTHYRPELATFCAAMAADLDRFQREDFHTPSPENTILVSCVPWYSYTGLSFHMKSDLNFLRPMFVWGKYEERDGAVTLPFTIQVHHAVADGYHCHLLFQSLEEILAQPELPPSSDGTPGRRGRLQPLRPGGS